MSSARGGSRVRLYQLCTLLEVWVLGVGMSTLVVKTVVRRVSGTPSTDDPGSWSRHLQWQSRAGD
jgi:hypothetical protein